MTSRILLFKDFKDSENHLDELNINEELNDWLFDYIFNEDSDIDLMFTEYLEDVNKKYEDFVKSD